MNTPVTTLLPGLSVVDKKELALDTFEEEQKKFTDALEKLQLFYTIQPVQKMHFREVKNLLRKSDLCNRYKALSISAAFRAVKDDISVLVLLLMITSEVEIQKRRMRTVAEVYEFEPLCILDLQEIYPKTILEPRSVPEKLLGLMGVNRVPASIRNMLGNNFTVHSENTGGFSQLLETDFAGKLIKYKDTHFEFHGRNLILKLNQRLSVDNMIRLINCGYKLQLA